MKCPRCGSARASGHSETLHPLGEVDRWAPVRDEGFLCSECGLIEKCTTDAGADYDSFRERWDFPVPALPSAGEQREDHLRRDALDVERARAWTWPDVDPSYRRLDKAGRVNELALERAERTFGYADPRDPKSQFQKIPPVPRNEQIEARVLANPDDSGPRRDMVRWLRTLAHPTANITADFIEGQLRIAEAYAVNPTADVRDQLVAKAFTPVGGRWWHRRPSDLATRFMSPLGVLDGWGYVEAGPYYRGFIESVAVKAETFLEIADELYDLAPIRQLEITYCKGINHDNGELWRELLMSPHLDRIRALRLPVRVFGTDKGSFTELNRLTDKDLELLADSDHLRKLRVLDLEDERLTVRAFDAVAATRKLPELSAVYWNVYNYIDRPSFKPVPDQTRHGPARPLLSYTAELEGRHGPIPWLHVSEHYGSYDPDIEAVIEHPVAVAGGGARTATHDRGDL